jgi:predicted AAA+ superfamily ATPase
MAAGDDAPLPRLATTALQEALARAPVVVLMGARGTGKATLLRGLLAGDERGYVSLDDFDLVARARTAPDELVRSWPRLMITEVQREPGLLGAVARAVREDGHPGRFVLTSGVELRSLPGVAELLGDQAAYLRLWPLTRGEQLGLGVAGLWGDLLDSPMAEWPELVMEGSAVAEDWRELARLGGYPAAALEMEAGAEEPAWFRGYTRGYLERDLRDLSATENVVDVHALMRAACARIGGVVNQAELARATGISTPTLYRYLKLLESSYQLVRLEPYARKGTKRLVKSPRLHWSDTGLALSLAGEESPHAAHLANLVLGDLLAWRDAQLAEVGLFYWRTQLGEEVDFLLEQDGRLLPVQVTAATRVVPEDARPLRTLRRQYGSAVQGALLLHAGEEVSWVDEGVLAVPWWRIL